MTQEIDNDRKMLAQVLDTWGSDRSRWPSDRRARLAHLLETDATSRRLVAEARALDRVLDRAPLVAGDRMAALADRIMASAVEATGKVAAPPSSGRVVSFPSFRLQTALKRPSNTNSDDALTGRTAWQSAALIAASLLIGVYIGAGSTVLPIMQDVAESVGIVAELDVQGLNGLDEIGDEESL